MKRVFSLVLALMLVLGMVPAFAAGETGAELLLQYGFITGDQNGDPMVAKDLTRSELAALIAELNGVKDQAGAFAQPADYDDWAKVADWAKPYVAYAKANNWMSGYPDGTFGPEGTVSAQELVAVLMNALGYPVEWTSVIEDAEALGIKASGSALTRGEAFEAMWVAVSEVPVNGEDVTLGVKLGKLEPSKPVVTDLAVESVTATSLIEVVVEYNQDVTDNDEVADEDNYDLNVEDVDKVIVDGNMVRLFLEDKVDNQKKAQLEISDAILGNDEVFDFEFFDDEIPEALSAEVVGIRTVKVTFSEPVTVETAEKKSNYKINDGKLYIKKAELTGNGREVNIELYSALEEGEIDVYASGVEDYFGFTALGKTFTVNVVPDEEAPYVVGFEKASPRGITLIFNEEVTLETKDNTDFYHTNKKNAVEAYNSDADESGFAIDSDDATKLILRFDEDSKLPNGTAYLYVLEESLQDLWENDNEDITYEVEIEKDTTKPEVKTLDVKTETTVLVTYTEEVDTDTAKDKNNYTLLQDGKEYDKAKVKRAEMDGKSKVLLTFSKGLEGDFALVVSDVEDLSGNEITETTIAFTVDDLEAPNADKFKAYAYPAKTSKDDYMIRVTFTEEMATDGEYSIDDLGKYAVELNSTLANNKPTPFTGKYKSLEDLDDVEIDVINNGAAVEIYIPYDKDDDVNEDVNFSRIGSIKIGRVADAADNKMVDTDGNALFSVSTPLLGDDDITKLTYTAKLVSENEVELKFENSVLEDFEPEEFAIKIDGTSVTDYNDAVAGVDLSVSSGDTTITVEFDKDETKINTGSTVIFNYKTPADLDDAKTTDAYGAVPDDASVKSIDEAKPEFDKAISTSGTTVTEAKSVTSNVIYLQFSEDLEVKNSAPEAMLKNDFKVEVGGDVLSPAETFYSVTINGSVVEIALVFEANSVKYDDKGDFVEGVIDGETYFYNDYVIISLEGADYLVDGNANLAADFDDDVELPLRLLEANK